MNKGLYIHFPFCQKKCNYCDFYSVASASGQREYVDALLREINSCPQIGIDTVYFGGGTPSLMESDDLHRLMEAISNRFVLDKDSEITLEANPMTANDADKLSAFRKAGINRLSLGVQSFIDSELMELGRGHTAEDAVNTVKMAQQMGFDNISIDLMLAIPYQTLESLEYNLNTAVALGVQHISIYALSIEEKTVFGVRHRRGDDLHLPDEDTEAEMYFLACRKLNEAGFEHYEISNFAKNKRRSRHNMKYWLGEEYIGIGASAHSYFNGVRYSTPPSIKEFCISAKQEDCYTNTPQDRAEEAIFLQLRLKDGVNVAKLEKEHSVRKTANFDQQITPLIKQGFCKFENGILSLTEKGFFVSNTIISKILNSFQFTY